MLNVAGYQLLGSHLPFIQNLLRRVNLSNKNNFTVYFLTEQFKKWFINHNNCSLFIQHEYYLKFKINLKMLISFIYNLLILLSLCIGLSNSSGSRARPVDHGHPSQSSNLTPTTQQLNIWGNTIFIYFLMLLENWLKHECIWHFSLFSSFLWSSVLN